MIEKLTFEPALFLNDVAELIVSRHDVGNVGNVNNKAALPNLSALQIVITPRAANDLRLALAKAAARRGVSTLLLPRMATLPELVLQQNGEQDSAANSAIRIASTGERVLDIFQELKKQRWFSAGETLALSRELVQLADELTHNLDVLPKTLEEHSRNLLRAYAMAKHNADFNFEAKLTYDIWQLLAQPSADSMDAPTRYALQLTAWAENRENVAPFYVVGSEQFSKRERAFFDRLAKRDHAGVVMIDQAATINATNFIASAFVGAPGGMDVGHVDKDKPLEPAVLKYALPCTIECYAAQDVEDEASAALATIKRWLAAGKRNIAVVALDRLAARRLRALAERDQILMTDEIGWPYSTTVSATAIMSWLDAKRDGFYFETLIDLIKSPFIFADLNETWGRARVKAAVLMIERAIRRGDVVAGLLRARDAVLHFGYANANANTTPTADAEVLLDRLIAADRGFTNARRTAAEWIDALHDCLNTLGLHLGLARDTAGAGLLGHIANAQLEMTASSVKLSSGEWTDWLRTLMEEARFRDASITSPIVMTSLEATRYRTFDAMILIGASDSNLPGKPATTGIFNQSVRRTLGLKTFQDNIKYITQDLTGLLNRSSASWISWQQHTTNEPQNPSPWIAALMLEAKRNNLTLNAQKQNSKPSARRAVSAINASRPAPVLEFGQIPAKISASGYQSLIDCPYQYFSRAVLKCRETDDVQEEMEKRDFGEFVHDILNRFHRRYPVITGVDFAILKAALIDESAAVFADAPQQNFISRAWRLQWESAVDGYLSWQLEREEKNWRWRDGEVKAGFSLALENGQSVQLEGRIDRIDDKLGGNVAEQESAVIDYKARAHSVLSKKLKDAGEDVQLPVYIALVEALDAERKITEASYLSIERQGVKTAPYPAPELAGQQHVMRLQTLFESLYAGAALPAQGIESICQYCEARGLCRRDYWLEAEAKVDDAKVDNA